MSGDDRWLKISHEHLSVPLVIGQHREHLKHFRKCPAGRNCLTVSTFACPSLTYLWMWQHVVKSRSNNFYQWHAFVVSTHSQIDNQVVHLLPLIAPTPNRSFVWLRFIWNLPRNAGLLSANRLFLLRVARKYRLRPYMITRTPCPLLGGITEVSRNNPA